METREFGSTGVRVSRIGQGTWQITKNGVEALRAGIDLGMTHIDTAELYTGAEEIIAKAIAGQRQKVFLVSKVMPSNASYKGTLKACDESLKRLKTDYLDVYLLHWWSGSHPIEDTIGAMEELVAAGKTRFIGVSNLDEKRVRKARGGLRQESLACNQVLYHLASRGIEHSLLPYCDRERIAVVAYTPFGPDRFPAESSKQGKVLSTIAAKHGRTPRQVALNFVTRHHSVFTIPKAETIHHVRENAGVSGWNLDNTDLQLIDTVFPPPTKSEPLDMV